VSVPDAATIGDTTRRGAQEQNACAPPGAVVAASLRRGQARDAGRGAARRRGDLVAGAEPKDQEGHPMRTQGACDTISPVAETGEIVELTMRLVVGSDPIQGSTRVAGGERREFWGWLELAEVVQQTADGDDEPGDPGTSSSNGTSPS